MEKKIRVIGAALVAAVWIALVGFAWFGPAKEMSEAERRPLAQMPDVKLETLLNGKFMGAFEDYTLDQFPLRDTFRSVKALFHKYVLGQRDNNDIYVADGHVAELAAKLDEGSVNHALQQFQLMYDLYLADSKVYSTVVPDKGYYLAEPNGYPAMDYEKLFSMVRSGMPWAEFVDITGCLTLSDYYFTDTHWKQENILPVAQALANAMGVDGPKPEDFTAESIERPFYGVYYGQAALPMDPDELQLMRSDVLDGCTVYNFVNDAYTPVYDRERLEGKDMYEAYLSGAQSLLRIENPKAATDRELVVIRDSFGSSLVPLLAQDYKTVTLVDIRYINAQLVGRYVDFAGKDVLFMYSSLVLNKNLI